MASAPPRPGSQRDTGAVVQDRERLRRTFDRAADLYQDARPEYPEGLFDRLVDVTRLRPGDRVLEVGAGPGKATVPLSRRGLRVTALEPGPALAACALDYDADGYIRLLSTFSGHIAMAAEDREQLFTEIRRRLAQRPDGLVRRGWGAVLHIARLRSAGDKR
jgi:SAM-dependent methyltransferase